MGHKVHPRIFRIGTLYQWNSRWFSRRDFASFLRQDMEIKKFLKKELKEAAVSQVDIERSPSTTTIIIYSAKPGVIIGRGGQGIEELKKKVRRECLKNTKATLNINIKEITDPNLHAELIVQQIAVDIEKRLPFRRAMKQAIGRVEKSNAKGVKIQVSGRLNGAEIARQEKLTSGSLPLHTLRADIDYARGVARTTYGAIGIKVWIYRGEVFQKNAEKEKEKAPATAKQK